MIKVSPLGDYELIVSEILSRLPAKSLIRFKCVCKTWQYLIQKDPHFIGLHFTRSQTRSCNGTVGATSLLIMVPSLWYWNKGNERCFLSAELLLPSDECGNVGGGGAVQGKIPFTWPKSVYMLNIVNGLFCFVNTDKYSVCVYNPSTRESTLWEGDLGNYNKKGYTNCEWDTFGYDIATKDYKVVSFWSWFGGAKEMDSVCVIFSMRHKSWRFIDAVPPVDPILLHLTNSVYVNGSIYWLRADGQPLIVQLNFVTEKFRVISVPSSVIIGSCGRYKTDLMEMGGRLALLAKVNVNPTKARNKHGDNVIPTSLKMCILHEDQDKTKNSTATSAVDYPWIEESFTLPPTLDWRPERVDVIPIPGTDWFIVKLNDYFSFYYYNWKNKNYSRKFVLDGTESFCNENGRHGSMGFYPFTENLLPLN
ncbi:hypothetical protein MKW92_027011 [Papaver armeniacum]|nr:hypothetical protein MKW92_027011 [Papaver armeniacum]